MPEAAGAGAARPALLGAEACRLHAAALLVPTPRRRAAVLLAGRDLLAQGDAQGEGAAPWREGFASYLQRLESAGDAAEPVHVALFEAAVDGVPCPAVAAHYLRGESRAWEPVPEADELCRRLGVTPARALGGRPDHASVELELLSILARHEAQAIGSGDAEGAWAARAEAERFLSGHVLAWFPRFADAVRKNDSLGVAGAAAASAVALLRHEQERLAMLMRQAEPPPKAAA